MKVSEATSRNWRRLKTGTCGRLRHRANKSCSEKRICPLEYIDDRRNEKFAYQVLRICAEHDISRRRAVFSLAVNLLKQKDLFHSGRAQTVLAEFSETYHRAFSDIYVPENEADILGFVYQCLLTEGEKSIAGSYYTPHRIVESMLEDFDFSDGKTFFDPCCGSGAFLLAAGAELPQMLWGCDKDPVAVFIARVNLLCKYREHDFIPQIFCCDYLAGKKTAGEGNALFRQKFDLIASNPPWGAEKNRSHGVKGESSGLFFRRAAEQLKPDGRMNFLLPEAVLRVKLHAGLREFILQRKLEKIVIHSGSFTGVMTGYAAVQISNAPPAECFEMFRNGSGGKVSVQDVENSTDHVFAFISDTDRKILSQICAVKHFFLDRSDFALGIVTGDNKNKVKNRLENGMEPVFTGKEVRAYRLSPACRFLHYDRKNFQQVAKDEYYRAPEKLVYKFISDRLVFALDDTRSLVLNSANILIPHIPGMSIRTVLGFLNSNVLRYYYSVMFGDVKILKSSLMQLPFPEISGGTDAEISRLVDEIISGNTGAEECLQKIIYSCCKLTPEQIEHVENTLQFP